MNLRNELEQRIQAALVAAGAPEGTPAIVAPSGKPQFGDYQANGVMAAAKKIGTNPRELAGKVVEALGDALADIAEPVEIAGPGFLNIRLRNEWLGARCAAALADEDLGTPPAEPAQTVVVDYCAPNLAKEMHVGHLRSTIIGDAMARVLEFLGHNVIRQNHVGDWGTQFGMLTAYLHEQRAANGGDAGATLNAAGGIADMEEFYRQAKKRFDEDPAFADLSREYVVRLQSGDPEVRQLWEFVVRQSMEHSQEVLRRMTTTLTGEHARGESAYNDDLPAVVADLDAAGLLSESEGARCVFLEEFTGKDGEPLPVIIQKTGGGYLYATTDLAAMRYRVKVLGADRILYVVDARQALHFRQVFAVARAAGFVPEGVSLEHVAFGTMMGPDGKPFKTRTGGTVKLMDLLTEAEQRAYELVSDKSPDLPEDARRDIAAKVGIGAVKYADLSQNRASDYVFDFDRMISLEGNTAPYMQYAYARVRSIFRKGELDAVDETAHAGEITISEPAERELALRIARFPETIAAVAAEAYPHLLCGYLFELAGAFMGFYENCPVLKSDEPVRSSRLRLCLLTARIMDQGLGLLGIDTIEQM